MILRECLPTDIPAVSALAHRCHTTLGQATSFMYKDLDRVTESFAESLGKNSVQLLLSTSEGPAGYIHVVDDEVYGSGDVLGPFVPSGSPQLAVDLLEGAQVRCRHIPKFKFNLSPANFLVPVLVGLGAVEKEHNYSLALSKHTHRREATEDRDAKVAAHSPRFDGEFRDLFDLYFQDSYIGADDLLANSSGECTLLDLVHQDGLVGFVCFRPKIGYIDFLAVAGAWQGQGFGRHLLNEGIHAIGMTNPEGTVRLNVDLDSERALKLYREVGFEVVEEFVSFHLENKA